jgi:DNA-binding transcriptional LysR family regulator
MDLEELRAFLAVVQAGSFFAAADALSWSRTTLRRKVASLEARAGVRLLESTRSGVVLTEAGQALAKRGESMLEEAAALIASVRELGREPSGELRFVLPVGLPPHVLTPMVAGLRSRWPHLAIRAHLSTEPLAESLVDVDVVVHFGDLTPKGTWISHVMLRVAERLVASEEYLARRGTPKTADDLEQHEVFAWQPPGEDAHLLPLRAGGELVVRPMLVTSDIHVLHQCAFAGHGIAFVPDGSVPDPAHPRTALVPVLEDVIGRERALRISVPAALADVPKIKLILASVPGFLERTL